MTKFKVGDRVQIKKDMKQYYTLLCNKIGTVMYIDNVDDAAISWEDYQDGWNSREYPNLGNSFWFVDEDAIELVEEPPLKVGDVVKHTQTGNEYPVTYVGDEVFKVYYLREYYTYPLNTFTEFWRIIREEKENTMQKGKYIIGTIGNKAAGMKADEVHVSKTPHLHDTLTLAKKEAERLATSNPGVEFVVLEVKGIVSVNTVLWK